MAKIYKRSDKIKIKIDDVVFEVSPLSLDQKSEIQEFMLRGRVKGDVKALNDGLKLLLKHSIKGIQGLENQDDSAYVLKFQNGVLDDECVDELANLEFSEKLSLVCMSLVNKIPKEFTDEKGDKLEGVEYVKVEVSAEKK